MLSNRKALGKQIVLGWQWAEQLKSACDEKDVAKEKYKHQMEAAE